MPTDRACTDRAYAEQQDAADPLAGFRDRFVSSPEALIYLDGNSLGPLAKATRQRIAEVVDREWGEGLVRSWHDWVELPTAAGDLLGEHLAGAAPGQIAVCDSTTVNLYKLAHAALDARPGRDVLITDDDNFPTDRYVLAGVARERGGELRLIHTDIDQGISTSELAGALDDRVALVSLSHVAYRSGALADMDAITAQVHEAGALMLWDLCHAIGAVPVSLDAAGADLAVGCTYKYLNAGPGSPAFLYVRRELQDQLQQPVWGWFGQADQFAMGPGYEPAAGHRQVPDRDPEDHRHGRGAGGHEAARRGGHGPAAGQEHRADQHADRAGRRVAGPARVHRGHPARPGPPRRARQPRAPGRPADQPGADPRRAWSATTARRTGCGSARYRSRRGSPRSGTRWPSCGA